MSGALKSVWRRWRSGGGCFVLGKGGGLCAPDALQLRTSTLELVLYLYRVRTTYTVSVKKTISNKRIAVRSKRLLRGVACCVVKSHSVGTGAS